MSENDKSDHFGLLTSFNTFVFLNTVYFTQNCVVFTPSLQSQPCIKVSDYARSRDKRSGN